MAEIPNLFTFFVLAAINIPSIVTADIVSVGPKENYELICNSLGNSFGLEKCAPICGIGNLCFSRCECEDGKVYCDTYLESCSCHYYGVKWPNCTEPCDEGFYGLHCGNKCRRCENNATCDRFYGECPCSAGYLGSLCKEKCPYGTHGYLCNNECKCQNEAICHHVDGSCECTAGWMGPECAEPCPRGAYGINCSKTCDCFKNAPCNAKTGDCLYTEDMFDCHCDVNSPSEGKNLNVDQDISSILSTNNRCLPGLSGKNCENRACPANKWGDTCSNECKCKNRSYCHPVTGSCWCEPGWTGEDCSVTMNE